MARKDYTDAEKEILRQYYPNIATPAEMEALLPGRKWDGIMKMAHRMGVERATRYQMNAWTAEEETLLRELHGTMSNREIARRYFPHRTPAAVQERVNKIILGAQRTRGPKESEFQLTKTEKHELSQRFHELFAPEIQQSESIVLR